MSKRAFAKISEGLEEVLAIARGEAEPARVVEPSEPDVKVIRGRIGLSQKDFAAAFGFTPTQISEWEQGRSRPKGGNRAYLLLIGKEPDRVREMLAKALSSAA